MKRKKRCRWCLMWFIPHHRLKDRQVSCGDPACRRQQKLLSHRCWKKKERQVYRQNQKDWQKHHPHYWRLYRNTHPEYAFRNRAQSRIRKFYSKIGLQKRIDILDITDKSMEYWHLPRFAKQTRSLTPLLWAYERGHESTAPDP